MKVRSPSDTVVKLLVVLLSTVGIPHPSFAAAPRPNVLLIVADDLGYNDVGLLGCKDIPAPHLDATKQRDNTLICFISDIGEKKNLAAEDPTVLVRFDAAVNGWDKEMIDPVFRAGAVLKGNE